MAKRKEDDPQFEIVFYENILKHSPDFIEAFVALGNLYTREGHYQKGLEVDQRLAKLRPDDATVHYNLACSYSLMNEVPKARDVMRSAFLLGYDDFAHLEKDPDLLNLLADIEFTQYLKETRPPSDKKAGAKAGEGA